MRRGRAASEATVADVGVAPEDALHQDGLHPGCMHFFDVGCRRALLRKKRLEGRRNGDRQRREAYRLRLFREFLKFLFGSGYP